MSGDDRLPPPVRRVGRSLRQLTGFGPFEDLRCVDAHLAKPLGIVAPPQPAGSIAEKASDRKVELRHRTVRLPEMAQGSAPAAPDKLAPERRARLSAARQHPRPDARIVFGGEVSFRTSLSLHIIRSPRPRVRAAL